MIIFTDIDGTIYDYEGKIPESTVTAIRQLRNNGHKVYLVTGRSKAENKKELWDIGFDGIICGNGSYVEDNGEVLMHKCLSKKECKDIVDWCISRDLEFYEESNNGLFASKGFCKKGAGALRIYMKGKGLDDESLKDLKTEDVIHGLIENAELYRDDLNKISFLLNSYDDYLEAKNQFSDLSVGTWGGVGETVLFGDVGVANIDKATAIEVLLKHQNVNRKDTIAIGDARIDIPMLEYCNIGIAMGSGGEQIKAMADYVTDDVDKDGFDKAFRHFGLI